MHFLRPGFLDWRSIWCWMHSMYNFLKDHRFLSVCLIFLLIGGCAFRRSTGTLSDHLNLNWQEGERWKVFVEFWPDRLKNPYSEDSRIIRTFWTYKVLEVPKESDPIQVLVNNGMDSYLLYFNKTYNLLRVSKILKWDRGTWKTRNVQSSPTGGGAFLPRDWSPAEGTFWLHPGLNAKKPFVRHNYIQGGRTTGSWMVQRVSSSGEMMSIKIKHQSSRSRAVFRWKRGESWWKSARYFNQQRLIMRARQINR